MPLWGLTMIVTKEDIMNLIFHKCFYGVAIGETKIESCIFIWRAYTFRTAEKKLEEILII